MPAALFTKFDPQAFLENEKRQGGDRILKISRREMLSSVTGWPFRNPCAGIGAAKPAKPAKDGPFDPANGRADWTAEDWRARFDERAGFLEHDGGLLRVQAEVQAFQCCLVEWLNRNPSSSPAGRCAWCGKSETPGAMVCHSERVNTTHGFTPTAGPLGTNPDGNKQPSP